MSEAILGIDISKKELVAALLIDNKNCKNKFTNNTQGFIELSKWFAEKGLSKVKVCMEATGSYGEKVADFLYNQGHKVSVVNPACIKSYARSRLTRHKTDELDALLIAEYARKNTLCLYWPRETAFKELKSFYRCQQNLKMQHTQLSDYLKNEDSLPKVIITTYRKLLKELEKQIDNIELSISNILADNSLIKQAYDNLQTIPGIGKSTMVIIGAVMRKLLHIIFGIIKHQAPFNPHILA